MTTPEITIREAVPQDVNLVLQFIRKKAAFDHAAHWLEATEAQLTAHLFGPQPVAVVLLAYLAGQPVGFVTYFRTFSSYLCRPGIWLDDLFVDESARGQGVGKAMLAYIAKLADERGYGRVEWVTSSHNAKALAFYQSHGAEIQETSRVLRFDRTAISRLAAANAT